ncbi:MAG: gliding motility-associated C-terminal domain-containing protein, partial [Crocinitomicaceae bacterium]
VYQFDLTSGDPATIAASGLLVPSSNVIDPHAAFQNGPDGNMYHVIGSDLYQIENTEVIILNRWGNIVYSSTNYQNNWDGKDASGEELVDGVYTYKFKTEIGEIGHGFVHLVR